jgi:hypothetical protein
MNEKDAEPIVRMCLDTEGDYTFVPAEGDDDFEVCICNPLADWPRALDLAHTGGFLLPVTEQDALAQGVPFFVRRARLEPTAG